MTDGDAARVRKDRKDVVNLAGTEYKWAVAKPAAGINDKKTQKVTHPDRNFAVDTCINLPYIV